MAYSNAWKQMAMQSGQQELKMRQKASLGDSLKAALDSVSEQKASRAKEERGYAAGDRRAALTATYSQYPGQAAKDAGIDVGNVDPLAIRKTRSGQTPGLDSIIKNAQNEANRQAGGSSMMGFDPTKKRDYIQTWQDLARKQAKGFGYSDQDIDAVLGKPIKQIPYNDDEIAQYLKENNKQVTQENIDAVKRYLSEQM